MVVLVKLSSHVLLKANYETAEFKQHLGRDAKGVAFTLCSEVVYSSSYVMALNYILYLHLASQKMILPNTGLTKHSARVFKVLS